MPTDIRNARLWRVPLRSELSPEAALLLIRDRPWPFALVGRWAGGGALLGCDPLALADPGDDPLALLDRLPTLSRQGGGAVVGGGWFGWLGYGVGGRIEDLPPQPPRLTPLPVAHLAYYDHLLRRDPDGRWWFEALVTRGRERELRRKLAWFRERVSFPPPVPETTTPGPFRPVAPGAPGHLRAVAGCLELIRAGEIFQANLRLRLAATWQGDLAGLFARAAGSLRPAYGACFLTPWGGLASMSPELFLRRRGASVETAPIKGTVPRPVSPLRAAAALASLRGSPKDAAEHVMTVDVARNDLGRVCAFGSVEAASAPAAEPHPGLWHLVSRVSGRLRPGVGDRDLVRAAFPPASVTGAPKIEAMRAIAELESTGREVYTGAIGYASPVAGLELSVAIRTFEVRDGRIWLDVGGGIVADSAPEAELEECLAKARPLVRATGSTVELAPAGPPQRTLGRWRPRAPAAPPALRGGERPDPARGVLETILVRGGRPQLLDRHLARLAESMEALYGTAPQGCLRRELIEAAARDGSGVLRVRAHPDGRIEVSRRPLPCRPTPVPLQPYTLPGGLGGHKWADRRLLEALAQAGSTPLLVDADGTVLEAAWGNVWIAEGQSLLTPPADGRILPGVRRAAILQGGEAGGRRAAETPISLERLAAADRVFVSSTLAGLVWAALDGVPSFASLSQSPYVGD